MPKDFNLGLVFLSYLVAVTASHVTLLLGARVRDPHASNWKLWVLCGGFAMGIGIWSMHFVATLALRLPIRVLYDLSLTALSWVFAIVACGAAFIVLRRLTGKHREFLLPGALIGIGIASMHYTGDASMRLSPGIQYDPVLFTGQDVMKSAEPVTARSPTPLPKIVSAHDRARPQPQPNPSMT